MGKRLVLLSQLICLAAFGRAVDDPSAALDVPDKAKLETLRKAGFDHYRAGEYRQAYTCYTDLLRYSQMLGIRDYTSARDLYTFAGLNQEIGDFPAAKELYLRVLTVLTLLGQSESALGGSTLLKLGGILQLQGSLSEAEQVYNRAIQLLQKRSTDDTLLGADALCHLATLYITKTRYEDASRLLARATAIAEKTVPPGDPRLITFLDLEASLLAQTGKYTEAEKKWLVALSIAERNYKNRVLEYSGLLLHLGQMYSAIDDYPAATMMLRRCLEAETTSESDPRTQAITMSLLADVYTKQRKIDEAEPLAVKSIDVAGKACSTVPLTCSMIHSTLAEYYQAKSQWAHAEQEFRSAMELRLIATHNDPVSADLIISLARVLRKLKRKQEAKSYQVQAEQILESNKAVLLSRAQTVDVRAFRGR